MKLHIHAIAALVSLSLLGCSPAAVPTENPASVPADEPSATNPPAEAGSAPQSQGEAENLLTFDEMGIIVGFDYPDGFSQGVSTSVMGAYQPLAPFDLPYPQNARMIFTSYTDGSEQFAASGIRVFRVDEINALEAGALESLNAVLEGQPDHHTDFPRMAGAGSVIDAQITPLAFQNGSGYRYLLTKSFSADPLYDTGLTYMYQGVTSDDTYFVSFIMDVDAPFLAEYIGQPLTTVEEFEAYYQNVNNLVETANGDQFTPSLTMLDELISSFIVMQR